MIVRMSNLSVVISVRFERLRLTMTYEIMKRVIGIHACITHHQTVMCGRAMKNPIVTPMTHPKNPAEQLISASLKVCMSLLYHILPCMYIGVAGESSSIYNAAHFSRELVGRTYIARNDLDFFYEVSEPCAVPRRGAHRGTVCPACRVVRRSVS